MARFHPLKVTDVQRETPDAVVLTLEPRVEDRALFDFTQGQYLTFRRAFDGEELRRSYSICTGKDEGCLKIGVKRIEGGTFSTWVNEELAPGTELEAMPPAGSFFAPIDPESRKQYLAVAAGSGITPVLSILKTVLAREPQAQFTLVYANRKVSSIMFREELEDLKNRYLGRLSVLHILEAEAQEIDLFTGRITADKMAELFQHWIDPKAIDTAFICGPEGLMLTVAASLRAQGLSDDRIRFELFAGNQGRAKAKAVSHAAAGQNASGTETTLTLDGTTHRFHIAPGQSVLDAALAQHLDAPWSCKAGVCSTCRCKVLEGEVEMAVNHALEDYEVRAGYVLGCQAYPRSATLVVSYDE